MDRNNHFDKRGKSNSISFIASTIEGAEQYEIDNLKTARTLLHCSSYIIKYYLSSSKINGYMTCIRIFCPVIQYLQITLNKKFFK